MKKSLLTLAILGTATLSAHAGIVLYGEVDAGFSLNHAKTTFTSGQPTIMPVMPDDYHAPTFKKIQTRGLSGNGDVIPRYLGNHSARSNSFKFSNGLLSANKIGLRGEEDINGMTVGFKLENSFNLSSGDLSTPSKIFDREARLYVRNNFGELALGRFGGLGSAAGSYDIFFENADAFDGGDNLIPWAYATTGRMDNSIAYQSPEVMGLQGTLMYSFNKDGEQKDKAKDNNRYAGAALTYKHDRFTLVGSAEVLLRDRETKDFYKGTFDEYGYPLGDCPLDKSVDYKNGYMFNLGGNVDFGNFKLFAGGQISRHVNLDEIQTGFSEQDRKHAFVPTTEDKQYFSPEEFDIFADHFSTYYGQMQFNGHALSVGSSIPIHQDTLTIGAYYGSYKTAGHQELPNYLGAYNLEFSFPALKKGKIKTFGIAARLEHPLSKRTTLYTGAGYGETRFQYSYVDEYDTTHSLDCTAKLKHRVGQIYFGLNHKF